MTTPRRPDDMDDRARKGGATAGQPGRQTGDEDAADADAMLDDRLRALPPPDQDALTAARIHRRTRGAFLRHTAARNRPFGAVLAGLGRGYDALEPVLVATVVVSYLGWAIDAVAGIWR